MKEFLLTPLTLILFILVKIMKLINKGLRHIKKRREEEKDVNDKHWHM